MGKPYLQQPATIRCPVDGEALAVIIEWAYPGAHPWVVYDKPYFSHMATHTSQQIDAAYGWPMTWASDTQQL